MKIKRAPVSLAALAIALSLLLSACGGVTDVANAVSDAVGQVLTGNVTGEVGKLYSTQWFDFTVKHIETVSSYAGYTPDTGYELIDVLIEEKCTFEDPTPMGTFDFRIDHDTFEDYIWPLDALDDTMMPDLYYMEEGETVEYHMVYEVPTDTPGLNLIYVEEDEEENIGTTFTIVIR